MAADRWLVDDLDADLSGATRIHVHGCRRLAASETPPRLRPGAWLLLAPHGGTLRWRQTEPMRLAAGDLLLARLAGGERLALAGRCLFWQFQPAGAPDPPPVRSGSLALRGHAEGAGALALAHAECRGNDRWRRQRLTGLLLWLVAGLRRHLDRHGDGAAPARTLSAAQCETIERVAMAGGSPTSADLARTLGFSRAYTGRLIHATYGCEARRFLVAMRLRRAATLLQETRLPVAAVARELGYADPAFFTRQFRRVFGCTPSEHRRLPRHALPDLWRRPPA